MEEIRKVTTESERKIRDLIEEAESIKLLLDLIERATSLGIVKDFLKAKNLTFSAPSWDEVKKKRIIPALQDGRISVADLHALLRKTEGFGRQHVFLFKQPADRAQVAINEGRVMALLSSMGASGLADNPLLVDLPDLPTIVDVRYTGTGERRALTIKEIEKRITKKFSGDELDADTMTYVRRYQVEQHRAINAMRLTANGLLEIRLASRESATQYQEDLSRFMARLSQFFKFSGFQEVSLSNVKSNLWEKRDELKDLVRFSSYSLKNDEGISLRANASLSTDDLGVSSSVAKSLKEFKGSDTVCAGSNLFIKYSKSEDDEKEIHVLLNGENNEFAITAAITEDEYEYVLRKILEYN